jgi:hypothetical protein
MAHLFLTATIEMSPTPTQAKALLWPQLLYALAQVAGRDMDQMPRGRIWVEAVDSDTLKLFATDGCGLLIAKLRATHTLPAGHFGWLPPAGHLKKPALRECNTPSLVELQDWGTDPVLPLARIQTMLAGRPARGALDPRRAAAFLKATSAICQRVDVRVLKNATFVRCPHPEFQGEVRGVLANLDVQKSA